MQKNEEIGHALHHLPLLLHVILPEKRYFLMYFSLNLQSVAHHEVLDHPGNCVRFICCAYSAKLQFSYNVSPRY